MTAIKTPPNPGVYPTHDCIITLIVDVDSIMAATSQEEVIASVAFNDNENDPESNYGPGYVSNLYANHYVSWAGTVKNAGSHPDAAVCIFDVTENAAIIKQPPGNRAGVAHVDARVVARQVPDTDYTVIFWVGTAANPRGKMFEIDPKLRVNP